MASGKFVYTVKWIGAALVAGIVLDNWSGANTLASTGTTGVTSLVSTLKNNGTTSTATKAA